MTRAARPVAGVVLVVLAAVLLAPEVARADTLAELGGRMESALRSGSLVAAVGVAFVAGLATSLTPCVYPMVVITVSVFGARTAKTRLEGALLSTCFVLGIGALLTPLGVIVALTGGVFGSLLASPWVLGGLALLFVLLALSMFGFFELNLPPSWQNRLAQMGGNGYRGAFALGFANGLIAAPCTGPVLAVLLAWVGSTGNVTFGALSLFAYALGLGVLFWLVGTFAIALPKSGRWLESVKSAFGVLMLAMALYVVRDLLPWELPAQRNVTWIAVALTTAAAGLAAGAVHLSVHGTSWTTRLRKAVAVVLASGGLFATAGWLEAVPQGAHIAWMKDYEAARAKARRENRPLLVDFGASWCQACGELERYTFSNPRVVAEARDFVPVKIDLSPGEATEKDKELLASYDQRGLPLVVLHDKTGKEAARVTRFVEPDRMLTLMRRVD